MSAIFYTYRDGKKSTAYKYEEVNRIWYTKDKNGKDQITITIKDTTHSSWDLDSKDIELTQQSHEKAAKTYNYAMIEIGKKRRREPEVNKGKKIRKKKRGTKYKL